MFQSLKILKILDSFSFVFLTYKNVFDNYIYLCNFIYYAFLLQNNPTNFFYFI